MKEKHAKTYLPSKKTLTVAPILDSLNHIAAINTARWSGTGYPLQSNWRYKKMKKKFHSTHHNDTKYGGCDQRNIINTSSVIWWHLTLVAVMVLLSDELTGKEKSIKIYLKIMLYM